MKKLFLISTLFFCISNLFSQDIITKEQRDFIVKFSYYTDSEIFKPQKHKFKTEDYKYEDYFDNTISIEETESCFKLMEETAKIEFQKDFWDENRLYFTANILTKLNSEKYINIIEVDLHKNSLFYKNDTLKIGNNQGGGNNVSENSYQITRNYPLDKEQQDTTGISGSMIMKINFVIGYDFKKFNKEDIGKPILLGSDIIEIVDIIDNGIVLKGNTENIKIINFISKNKVSKPYSMSEKNIDLADSFTFSSSTIYKSSYENIFLKKMSFEEYDKLMTIDYLKKIQTGEKYKILKNVAKIGDNFILYKPIYKTYFLTAKL